MCCGNIRFQSSHHFFLWMVVPCRLVCAFSFYVSCVFNDDLQLVADADDSASVIPSLQGFPSIYVDNDRRFFHHYAYKIIDRGTNVVKIKFCKYFFVSLHHRNFTRLGYI